jgi:uncharacterized protein (TIGR02646 family)
MVRTRRRSRAPRQLRENKAAWTRRWKEILTGERAGEWATRVAKAALREPLLALSHGKCAFCESRLGKDAYAQIEHYVSRKVDPDGAFKWGNLLPVCQICNTSKGHTDHGGELLKPGQENPEPFFWIGPEGDIEPHPGQDELGKRRASETIRLCNLQRGGLRESRYAVATAVKRWLQRASQLDGLDEDIQHEWRDLSAPRFEHKLVVRHTLSQGNHPELADEDRRRFQATGSSPAPSNRRM